MAPLVPPRVPVWMWRAFMARATPGERRRFNRTPVPGVDSALDFDYAGDGSRDHRLDVLVPHVGVAGEPRGALPVYVYFHGGGWTSGDKSTLATYAASQAANGMVVVNANYRRASGQHNMRHLLEDATAVLDWTRRNVADFGGDPDRLVLGGDSAGGQLAALATSLTTSDELAGHWDLRPDLDPRHLRGLVQHCSVADFSVIFERGFIMSHDFVRMLLPGRGMGARLEDAARYLSPIEWVDERTPPTLVTSSVRDFLYRANLNLARRFEAVGRPADTLFLGRDARRARHTWQQDARLPESQAVYRRLRGFVDRVAAPAFA